MSAPLKEALEGGRVPDAIPFTTCCALYVPIEAHVGAMFQDMAESGSPQVDAYSKVLQVFFAIYSKVPEGTPARLFSEAVVDANDEVCGYRYVFLMDGQNVLSELDGFAHSEVLLYWENLKSKPDKKKFKKQHGKRFGEQWMAFFDGVPDWRPSLYAVFPDVDAEHSYKNLASEVFTFEQSFVGDFACALQRDHNNYLLPTGAFAFPRPEFVRPLRCAHQVARLKYYHVLQRELLLTRVSSSTVIGLAAAFAPAAGGGDAAAGVAVPPPAQRQRVGPDAIPAARVAMPRLPADVSRFLPLTPLSQAIGVVKGAIGKVQDPKARYILGAFCAAQMGDAFLHALRTSDQRSPGDNAMMDYATQTVNGVPTTSCYWNSRWLPVYRAMSSSEALISKCLAALEVYYSVDMCHHEALMLVFGAPDCFRLAFETMKFCAWIFSKGGGVSKSFMLHLLKVISVRGMIKMIGRFTAAAFAVNGTEDNPRCPNQTMQVIGIDDTDPDLFAEQPRNTLQAAALKSAMTSQVASVDTMVFTDEGDRIKKFIEAPLGGVFIILANIEKIPHQPFERRAQSILTSEVPSTTVDETVIQSWEAGLDPRQQSFSTEMRWLQYCQYMISQLQYAGLLPEFTYGAAGVILLELSAALKKDKDIRTFTRIDTSVLQRIRSYARLLEINKICLDAFCATPGEFRAIGVADFLKLAPRLFISVESVCNAAMFLIDGWLPSLRFVVADALRRFVVAKSTGTVRPLKVMNKTVLRFPFADVVHFIVAEVPSLTRNFTPNFATVASHLRAFLVLPAVDSPAYRASPDLHGKVVVEPGAPTSKVAPYVEVADGGHFDISIAHYQDLLVHQPRDFALLSTTLRSIEFDLQAEEASQLIVQSTNTRIHARCEEQPCAGCMTHRIATGAELMTGLFFSRLGEAVVAGGDGDASALARSFFWDPAADAAGLTALEIATRVLAERDSYPVSSGGRVFAHFQGKMKAYLSSAFTYDIAARRWERVPDAPAVQWLETPRSATGAADAAAARPPCEYASQAYEKVANILVAFLGDKNQLPRRIFAGPDPHTKDLAKFVKVGGGAYDPANCVTIRLKDRNRKMLGKVDLQELTKLLGDLTKVSVKVNYDLDTWTQERHFEANGIDPAVTLSRELLDDLSGLLATPSAQWDGYFVNGVPAKNLAPVAPSELPGIAAAIKQRLTRPSSPHEDDIFFPRAEVARKVALAIERHIPPYVFHLQSYDEANKVKTMCFAPLRKTEDDDDDDDEDLY